MSNFNIQMVDLHGQYLRLKPEIDQAVMQVLDSAQFVGGPHVSAFAQELARISSVDYCVPCGNGTDALQIALMALDLQPGDEVIVPSFTYIATAEVIALLHGVPVFVDVNEDSFTADPACIEAAITPKTKAIIVVHLYGQCAPMEEILKIGEKYGVTVIEDGAQSIGAEYTFSNGRKVKSGGMAPIGCTSFYPSKNLGAYGDGGAITTSDETLYQSMKKIANHGQTKKYHHEVVGINSRLDAIQAAILRVKLKHLPEFEKARQEVAAAYDEGLKGIPGLHIPVRMPYSTHVFHQYTVRLEEQISREDVIKKLEAKGIPTVVYYPLPQHLQKGFQHNSRVASSVAVSERLSRTVFSLPIHTEMPKEQIAYVCETLRFILTNG